MKNYGGAKTKTQKNREICEQDNKDFNPDTKRCVKKCGPGKERGENFRCKTTRKSRSIKQDNKNFNSNTNRGKKFRGKTTQKSCEEDNKDFNPNTKRCVKKCEPGKERDATFKCKKIKLPTSAAEEIKLPTSAVEEIKLPTSAVEEPNISRKDATELLNFVAHLEDVGRKYETTGIDYSANDLIDMIMYTYLIEKYNSNCFMYGHFYGWRNLPYKPFTIDISKSGLLGNDYYLAKYQKYVYKHIMLILNCIMKIKDTQEEIIIIPLIIYDSQDPNHTISHANMLIYRKTLNVIEHYEPHGKDMAVINDTINKDVNKILNIIVNKMNKINKTNNNKYFSNGDIKYMPPSNICPHDYGFQVIEEGLILPKNIKNKSVGFCKLWSLFFAEMTLANPQLSSKEIFDYIFDNLKHNALKTKTIIRGYLEIIYDKVINIIRDMDGVDLGKDVSLDKVNEIMLSDKFRFKAIDIANIMFRKHHNKHALQHFNEPNSAGFESLSPSRINSTYRRGMLDTPYHSPTSHFK